MNNTFFAISKLFFKRLEPADVIGLWTDNGHKFTFYSSNYVQSYKKKLVFLPFLP